MCFPKKHKSSAPAAQTESLRGTPFEGDPKLIVVGAGPAGLACATKLLSFGFKNVTILEADYRIGGRICTIPFADNNIDLGAQWCHGERGNVVFDIVQDLDLLETTGDIYVTFECIRSNGEKVSDEVVSRLKEMVAEIFAARHDDLPYFEGSFGEYLSTKYYAALTLPEYNDIDTTIAEEFFETFKKIESAETALGIDEISARGYVNYWECAGDYLLNWKNRGYAEFLRVLTEADVYKNTLGVLEQKIVFGATVEKIEWDREDARVGIKCEGDDELLVADHVILTMSLGVLKDRYTTLFEPRLPPEKVRAIEGLGFGAVCKIFVEFPERFWPVDWTGFSALWRENDSEEIRETPNAWLEDIFGFYCYNYQPRVLLGWIVGKFVVHVESLPLEEVQEGVMYLLSKFLPGWDIPEPLNIFVTNWGSDPNFLGAYSFRTMNTEEVGTSARELMIPLTVLTHAPKEERATIGTFPSRSRLSVRSRIPALAVKPVVQFAGEATSDHYYSTVHGAVESGWREARRLAGYYRKEL